MQKALQETVTEERVIEYDIETAVISTLDAKYKDIQEITSPETYEMVLGGLREYRELRLKIDAKHKDLKKEALAYGRAVDAEKNRLQGLVKPGEKHLKAIRKAEDDKVAAIETARIKIIHDKIANLKGKGIGLAKMSSIELKILYDELKSTRIEEEDYQEFKAEAMSTIHNTLIDIDYAWKNAEQREQEDAKRKQEAAQLVHERERQEERQKKINEQNRKFAEEQEADRKRGEEEHKKLADQQAKIDAEKAELEADRRADEQRKRENEIAKQAEEKAREDEKDRIEQERLDELERVRKEKEEAEKREALKPDKEKLLSWVASFNQTNNPNPRLKSREAQKIFDNAFGELEELLQDISEEIDQL